MGADSLLDNGPNFLYLPSPICLGDFISFGKVS
jgi:hypothetical protein